jgi:hypothetical protein
VNGLVHDFHERDAFSKKMGGEPSWVAFYQDLWPNATMIVRVDANSKFQEWGIDRHVYLPHGKLIAIDEKVRDPEKAIDRDGDPYTDILIEEFSVFKGDRHPQNKVGWTIDSKKHCDYIAYAIPLISKCYLLPFELLRLAAVSDLPKWKTLRDTKGRRCYPLDAPNPGYVTRNCGVAWPVLRASINEQMARLRGVSSLVLPTPTIHGKQAVFEWGSD